MQQERSSKQRIAVQYRPLGELIRGIFFLLFGLFAFFGEKLGLGNFRMSPLVMYIFGGILIAYGLFRIYRGVKQLSTRRTTED
jgi:lipopolysaccharide export LptBFGC system permease protein LptF